MKTLRRPLLLVLTTLALLSIPIHNSSAQKATRFDIDQWRDVLSNVKQTLKANYYDPDFHGMDIDARFATADAKMKSAQSLGQLVGIVAQVLLDLNDSHTFFSPPDNETRLEYGWRMKPVGDACFVGAVKPGSDAEAKGLQVGDRVLSIDGRPLDRSKIWLADYLYNKLRPQASMTLIVEKPRQTQQEIVIKAQVREGLSWRARQLISEGDDRLTRDRFYELSDDVLIWKMPQFELSEEELDRYFGKWKNRKALILDLRGNEGGYVTCLERLAGYLFASNIKIAEGRGRKQLDPMVAKSQKGKAFKGQVIVLIDGDSASAAEIFARMVQLEKRGIVIGDRSNGSVMQSKYYSLHVGLGHGLSFGISATIADVIMTDGKSLEHVGVIPDELVLPTPEQMYLNQDPVLSRAAALAGISLDPKKAGELFPVEWKRM